MPSLERGRGRARDPSGRDGDGQLPWSVLYYRAPDGAVLALKFLDGCPGTIDAQFTAVLDGSPRRRRRGSPAEASGRPCTGRWAAGMRSG